MTVEVVVRRMMRQGKLRTPDFGAGEIDKNSDLAIDCLGCRPNIIDGLLVLFRVPVGHVEAKHIDSSDNQFLDHGLVHADGTESGYRSGTGLIARRITDFFAHCLLIL